MKKLLLFFLGILVFTGFNSCSKDDTSSDNNVVIYKVPASIAAEYIAMAFCNAAIGVNYHLENTASFTDHGRLSFDSTFTPTKMDSAAAVKYLYNVSYSFLRFTTSPPKTVLDYTADGSFASHTLQSQDNQTGNSLTFTNLDQPQFTVNGNGSDGGHQYAVPDKVAFTSMIRYTLKDVIMDATTYLALSGTASITINGDGPANVSYSYSGTLTFTGDRKATLVLGGETYYISLTTGSVSK